MAYIKLIGKRDIDVSEDTNEKLLSDADYNRVATWAAVYYFPQGVFVPGDPNANPPVADSYRQPTGDEVFHALTEGVYLEIKGRVDQWYIQQAEAAAREAVTPIVLTPV
jgi:hypothetical protein